MLDLDSQYFRSRLVNSRNKFFCAATTSLMLVTAGCGGGGEGGKFKAATRSVVNGAVSLDGKPVALGTVSFTHKTSGLPSICPIENGTFRSPSDKGPQIGVNSVILSAKGEDGKLLWSSANSEDVAIDDTKITKDFALTSKQVKMTTVDKTKKRATSDKVWPGDE